jgi:hypothetical protein
VVVGIDLISFRMLVGCFMTLDIDIDIGIDWA